MYLEPELKKVKICMVVTEETKKNNFYKTHYNNKNSHMYQSTKLARTYRETSLTIIKDLCNQMDTTYNTYKKTTTI